jgi:hypothetical protein
MCPYPQKFSSKGKHASKYVVLASDDEKCSGKLDQGAWPLNLFPATCDYH